MARKNDTPIKNVLLVPDGNGGYINHDDLTPEEKAAFAKKLARRMGETLERCFALEPEVYAKI